jgi:ABC-type multidrug transport system ATPase subunit
MLQVKEISYSYGEVPAVTELSFEAKPSEVLVVLGPNGAGKTTTFELITGLRQCHSGEIRVGDRSVLEA